MLSRCCDVIGMHLGKCPINCCFLDAGEVILLCDTPASLEEKINLILAGTPGSCSLSLDRGLVSLLEVDHSMFECGWHCPDSRDMLMIVVQECRC